MKFKEMNEEELLDVSWALQRRDSLIKHLLTLNDEYNALMIELAKQEDHVRNADKLINDYMKKED